VPWVRAWHGGGEWRHRKKDGTIIDVEIGLSRLGWLTPSEPLSQIEAEER